MGDILELNDWLRRRMLETGANDAYPEDEPALPQQKQLLICLPAIDCPAVSGLRVLESLLEHLQSTYGAYPGTALYELWQTKPTILAIRISTGPFTMRVRYATPPLPALVEKPDGTHLVQLIDEQRHVRVGTDTISQLISAAEHSANDFGLKIENAGKHSNVLYELCVTECSRFSLQYPVRKGDKAAIRFDYPPSLCENGGLVVATGDSSIRDLHAFSEAIRIHRTSLELYLGNYCKKYTP